MRIRPICALAATAATAVALAACGGDDDTSNGDTTAAQETAPSSRTEQESGKTTPAGPKPKTIVVRGGEPVGDPPELEYDVGNLVYLSVHSDVADEVHVHGYDLSREVPAGGSVSLSFTADIEGIFEIELERRGVEIGELRVNP
ncbi:MAG TPA: hypothetical protein VFZ41_03985 [Solirubrobacterales bacterium]